MLNATNYTVWGMKMKVLLKIYKVWDTTKLRTKEPDEDIVAIGLLFQAIPEALILQAGEQETSKVISDMIKAWHLGANHVKEGRL